VSEVPDRGAVAGLPRHVLALVLLVVAVLGFAVGGSLRTALASTDTTAGSTATTDAANTAQPARVPRAGSNVASAVRTRPVAVAVATVVRPGSAAHRASKALPAGSGAGRRIVYQESTMHLWVVGSDGGVVRDYPVTGRPGWPRPGAYHVFSKATATASPKYGVTFRWMVRFAHGRTLNIGFHDIPRTMGSGRPIQAEEDLGAPVGHGGCVRQRTADARWLYAWATIGTPVVVLR